MIENINFEPLLCEMPTPKRIIQISSLLDLSLKNDSIIIIALWTMPIKICKKKLCALKIII